MIGKSQRRFIKADSDFDLMGTKGVLPIKQLNRVSERVARAIARTGIA